MLMNSVFLFDDWRVFGCIVIVFRDTNSLLDFHNSEVNSFQSKCFFSTLSVFDPV